MTISTAAKMFTITLAFVAACGTPKGDSDSETGDNPSTGGTSSSDGSSSSDGESVSSTGGGASEPTSSGGPLTTTGSTSEGPEETPETATSGSEEPPAGPCEAFCGHSIACTQGDPAMEQACLFQCTQDLSSFEGECHAASVAAFECMAGLTCEELEGVNEGDPGPCEEELALKAECAGGCAFGGGGPMDGSSCEWMQDCPLAPERNMVCDAESCQCFEDEQLVGECATDGACLDIETLADKMTACCGFPHME